MKQVLTIDQMKRLDAYTIQRNGISNLDLIHHAGNKLYEHLVHRRKIRFGHTIILVGGGHNGADALILGENLLAHGPVDFVVVSNNLSPETQSLLSTLKEDCSSIHEFRDGQQLDSLLRPETIIIDGMIGIGLKESVRGTIKEIIEWVNGISNLVISIDIPTGLSGVSGIAYGCAVKADLTCVMQTYKPGNLLNDALDHHGEIDCIDLNMNMNSINDAHFYVSKDDIQLSLNIRPHNRHKYDFGSVLTIGGNIGMTGAPVLSALAALRMGSGISSIGIYHDYYPYTHPYSPALMVHPYDNGEDILQLLNKRTAVAFGPGLGSSIDGINRQILEKLLVSDLPLVIDADGIRMFKTLWRDYSKRKHLVLTPHYGELGTFLGIPLDQLKEDIVEHLTSLSKQTSFTFVLKGPCTVIAQAGKLHFLPVGNPGMATAGSGDVLTGIILSLLGQGLPPLDAARYGVLVHGLCGDLAAHEKGYASMIASDLIEALPRVVQKYC